MPARRRAALIACLVAILLPACAPQVQEPMALKQRATPTPLVVVAVVGPTITPTFPPGTPTPIPDGTLGLTTTLSSYIPAEDPEGSKTEAFATLRDFTDPNGVYRNAWWFEGDHIADIYEILAVVFFTEGNLNVRVQQAVAARYLWYCGGTGTECSGPALINFLAYFQPWREPFSAGARFTSEKAQEYLPFASDLVWQRSGLVTALVPGAEGYIRNPDALDAPSPIDWANTPFHFANVDPSWDSYLREQLGRGPNGSNRLWVLTMAEASRVCPSAFICENMTKARQ